MSLHLGNYFFICLGRQRSLAQTVLFFCYANRDLLAFPSLSGFPPRILSHPLRSTLIPRRVCGKVSLTKAYPQSNILTSSYKIRYAVFLTPFPPLLSSANRSLGRGEHELGGDHLPAAAIHAAPSIFGQRQRGLFSFILPALVLFLLPRCRSMGLGLCMWGKP